MALLAAGIALGATMTATPVTAQTTISVGKLIKKLKKTFFTKAQANKRFYTKKQVNTKLGDYYSMSEIDTKLGDYYPKSEIDTKLAHDLAVQTGNGVGNNFGCASGTLGVGIVNGNGDPADFRFTFQVPGATPAYGQIRSGGSIRSSSANVTTVDHTAGSGVYCIHFSVAIGGQALEGSVVSLHLN